MFRDPNEQHHAERDESRTALHDMTEWDHAATQPDHGLVRGWDGRWVEVDG